MFGFSFTKIVFTIVMIFAVFWVYRQINLMTDGSEKKARVKKEKGTKAERQAAAAPEVEDLAACPACGAYVARGSNPGCGRSAKDCPMQA